MTNHRAEVRDIMMELRAPDNRSENNLRLFRLFPHQRLRFAAFVMKKNLKHYVWRFFIIR